MPGTVTKWYTNSKVLEAHLHTDLLPYHMGEICRKTRHRYWQKILFLSFQRNIISFTNNICKKCPSRIQCWDLNPRPSGHESPSITTRPSLLMFHLRSAKQCFFIYHSCPFVCSSCASLSVIFFKLVLLPQKPHRHTGGGVRLYSSSVTRLGDLLDFGHLFIAFGHN